MENVDQKKHETECRFECKSDEAACLERQGNGLGLGCTRHKGHKGKHAACGFSNHDLAVWE